MEAQAIRRTHASFRSRRPVHRDLVRQAPRRCRYRSFDGKDRECPGQRHGGELRRHLEDRSPHASTSFPRSRGSKERQVRVSGRLLQPTQATFGFELSEPRRLRGGYNGRSGSGVDATRPRDRGNSTFDAGPVQESLAQELRERERIEQELSVARRIQQASLPKEVPELEGWQISPHYRPAREVGGDFYDFHLLADGRVGLVVGDAIGKGVPAALVMFTTCGMLQLAAQALTSSLPGEVLERVNEALLARIPLNMFVTCFYAILDPKSGTLSYANAGHDLPYLHRHGDAEELRARGMPLGLMPEMGYEEKETILEAGESALFYSDGLVEADEPKGEMFGFPRLRALIAEHGEERTLGSLLLEELYTFVGEGWEQGDDRTLLTLRRSSSPS